MKRTIAITIDVTDDGHRCGKCLFRLRRHDMNDVCLVFEDIFERHSDYRARLPECRGAERKAERDVADAMKRRRDELVNWLRGAR